MNDWLPGGLFYFLTGIVVASALFTAFTRNLVHAAFSLLLTFLGLACLYLYLGADFVGLAQVLVYVGGILVLLLFGVMLTNDPASVEEKDTRQFWTGLLISVGLGAVLITIVMQTPWPVLAPSELPEAESTLSFIATGLLTTYLLPFEIASVLLLIALIGAVVIARGEPFRESGDEQASSGDQ